MSLNFSTHKDAIANQLEDLQRERRAYCARVSTLATIPDRSAEIRGYLRLIDNINAACLRLARSNSENAPARDASAQAA